MSKSSVILCILDGFGLSKLKNDPSNAIEKANTPTWDYFLKNYPHSELGSSGKDVGLPEKQMGNSEVGHMTIGAGRVINQDLVRINQAIQSNEFSKNNLLVQLVEEYKKGNKKIHIFGLCSDGGVHSHIDHILYIAEIIAREEIKICFHLFLDGRDVSPISAENYLSKIDKLIEKYSNISIASISGRFYAMDRDKKTQRTELAINAIEGTGKNTFIEWRSYLEEQYQQKITDEFIQPAFFKDYEGVKDGDSFIFTNFRSDRIRQLIEALDKKFSKIKSRIGMTQYFEGSKFDLKILFPEIEIQESLGEVISKENKKQLRIAETEKFAHVTFFFNGGRESLFHGEERILIPSPNVRTYDLQPEMSAEEITNKLVEYIEKKEHDFIVVNYANCDMVGHSGNMKAAIESVEFIDSCLKRIHDKVEENGASLIVTADHGNIEHMFNEAEDSIHTSHTLNPVPCILVGKKFLKSKIKLANGTLADIAPTVLELLKIKKPKVMSGKSLIKKSGEWLSFITAIFIALAIRTIIFEPYEIPSGSMKPNFLVGDYLFVSKYTYGISNASLPLEPKIMNGRLLEIFHPIRGEVIVFKSQTERTKNYIKRLIGLPGDEVQVIGGIIYINGNMVPRKEAGSFTDTDGKILKRYIETLPNGVSYYVLDDIDDHPLDTTGLFKVPEGHYFFMGDNRDHSADSRTGGYPIGFVPYDKFIGRAEMVIFSNPVHFYEIWKWPFNFYHDRFFKRVE